MTVEEAQAENRAVFMGGLVGQVVSGILWLLSAALGTWVSRGRGIAVLCLGGILIYPVTQLVLRALGRRTGPSADNPLKHLAMQVAFTVPLGMPVVGAATLHHVNWFYPACMVVVGAHYLPFVFLYGMRQFAVLCGLMVGGGIMLGLYLNDSFSLGGWLTGATLVVFGVLGGLRWRDEARRAHLAG
ncbi:MAG TPA: hypothetical protein VI504_04760 [Candidatus Eisenbacteria bacterium]|jgi:hypothetical protein